MGTRRCSFRQAKISGWAVVEWVAAALLTTALLTTTLPTTHPLLSECLPAFQQWRQGKETEQHSSSFVSIACVLVGSNTAVAASSSCPVRVASCLVRSLIQIPLAASSAASALCAQPQGREPFGSVSCQLMFACHSGVAQT